VLAFCAIVTICNAEFAAAQLAGDLNDDCNVDSSDVMPFVATLLDPGSNPMSIDAADVDGNNIADGRDIASFVEQLINLAACETCQTLANGFAGGTGTLGDPWQICNAAQLQLAGSFLNASFVLTSDIDLAGVTFTPIAATTFGDTVIHYNGTFDGAGHRVRNLTIQQPTTDVIGLFGKIGATAILQDLGVEDVHLSGKLCVGGLLAENNGLIRRCYVTGTVAGSSFVGGMIGDNRTVMEYCYAQVAVTGSSSVGGFAGVSFTSPTYRRCYSTGTVSGSSQVGGFIGGLIGSQTVTNCYWDTQSSGIATSNGGTGKTTAQMQQQATFVGWDFATIWSITSGDYPRLVWE
jgi:hypothetical protein